MVDAKGPSLSVVILAGGYSSRMGRDKAMMTLPSGLTLLANTVQVAASLTTDIQIVTPWPDRYRSVVPASVQFVAEPTFDKDDPLNREKISRYSKGDTEGRVKPSAGPLSGFYCGWQQVSADWCLLLPCDMPYLESSSLQQWWSWILAQQAQGWPDSTHAPTASLATGQEGWQPLCGFYHRRGLLSLAEQLKDGRRSFRDWLVKIVVAPYDAAPQRMFVNCNLPSDWSAVEQVVQQKD